MLKNSLWGDIMPKDTNSPKRILEEQAEILSQITNNKLKGEIRTSSHTIFENPFITQLSEDSNSKFITHSFFINAPFINYSFELLNVTHSLLQVYPLIIKRPNSYEEILCNDEIDFVSKLGSIMQSTENRKIIQSLIIQSGL